MKGKDDNDASLERVNNVVPVAIQFKTPHDIPNHIKTQLKWGVSVSTGQNIRCYAQSKNLGLYFTTAVVVVDIITW